MIVAFFASVDIVARVLGAIGTSAGVVAAVIAVLSYRRDRPQLKVTWTLVFETATEVALQVRIVNDGRQPIAIARVHVQNHSEVLPWWLRALARVRVLRWLNRRGWVSIPDRGGHSIDPEPAIVAARTLRPGEPAEFVFRSAQLQQFLEMHREEQLYIAVSDVLGRQKEKPLPGELFGFVASRQLQSSVAKHAAVMNAEDDETQLV